MTKVDIRTGTEGPRHDPYAYKEVTVWGRSGKVVAHMGLSLWLESHGKRRCYIGENPMKLLDEDFEKLVGSTPDKIELSIQRNKGKEFDRHVKHCPKAREVHQSGGYPGESFTICGCGHVLEYSFDRSAVE